MYTMYAEFEAICRSAHDCSVRQNKSVPVSWTVPAEDVPADPARLAMHFRRVFRWHSAWSGVQLIALGTVADFSGQGAHRFTELDRAWRHFAGHLPSSHATGDRPLLVGGFAFRDHDDTVAGPFPQL